MPNKTNSPAGLSFSRSNPLDEIRMAELHAASLVQQAGQTAGARLEQARTEGERCLAAARAAGRQAGLLARQQQLRAAQEDAARIQLDGDTAALELRQKGRAQLEDAVAWAVSVVLGELRERPGPASPAPAAGARRAAADTTGSTEGPQP